MSGQVVSDASQKHIMQQPLSLKPDFVARSTYGLDGAMYGNRV